MSLDQTDDAIDPVDAAGSERTPLTKSKPTVVRESPNNVFSPLSVASEATAPGDNSVDSSFSCENAGGSVAPSPIVRRDVGAAAGAEDDVEVGVSMSFASTGDGDDDDDDDDVDASVDDDRDPFERYSVKTVAGKPEEEHGLWDLD